MTRVEALKLTKETTDVEELKVYCETELKKIKNREITRKEKVKESKRIKENEQLKDSIVEVLRSCAPERTRVEVIMEKLGTNAARQKITSMCTQLVQENRICVEDINVKGVGKRKGYFIEG